MQSGTSIQRSTIQGTAVMITVLSMCFLFASGANAQVKIVASSTTTPSKADLQSPAPPVDPNYNKQLESILNQSIQPQTGSSTATSTPSSDITGTTTATSTKTVPPVAAKTTPTDPSSKPQTQQPAGQKTTTNTGQNQSQTAQPQTTQPQSQNSSLSTENNASGASTASVPQTLQTTQGDVSYYRPLDNLTPGVTYALSAIALALGITGAVLILRDGSGEQSRRVWTPIRQEPLLEQ